MSNQTRTQDHGKHVTTWLGAYLDNEVSEDVREQVEAHLRGCTACRAELDELRDLSILLQASPAPAPRMSDEAFTRGVINRLTPPETPFWQRAFKAGWMYAPLFMFGAWAFFQALGFVSGALLVGSALLPGAGEVLQNFSMLDFIGRSTLFGDLLRMSLTFTAAGNVIEQDPWLGSAGYMLLVNLVISGGLAALFISWLASWWAYHSRQVALEAADLQQS